MSDVIDVIDVMRIRANEVGLVVSEAELLGGDGVADAYALIESIRGRMVAEVVAAVDAIREKYASELGDAEAAYAMLVSLSR